MLETWFVYTAIAYTGLSLAAWLLSFGVYMGIVLYYWLNRL